MSKTNLNSTQKLAIEIQFLGLFRRGIELVKTSMDVRFYNEDKSENFSPEVQKIFFDTLKEFLQDHPDSELKDLMIQEPEVLGASGENSDSAHD